MNRGREEDVSQEEALREKSTLSFINKKFLLLMLAIWLTVFSISHFTEWQERRQRFTARDQEIRLENRERQEIQDQQSERTIKRQEFEQERRQRLSEIDLEIARERRAEIDRRTRQRQTYNNYGVW